MRAFRTILCATAAMGALAAASAASAATDGTTPAAAGAADQGGQLQEIVVTAERRETSVEKTPLAITVIGGQQLEQEGRHTIEEALRAVPSVQIRSTPFGSSVFIRGLGPLGGSEGAVNENVDGVYQSDGFVAAAYDLDRTEVLRGPQGTLYGRNATAGAVNVVTNDPTHDVSVEGDAEVGNHEQLRFTGALNAPIADHAAFRAAFLSSRHNGYLSNAAQDEDTQAARAKLLLEPSEDLKAVLTADFAHLGGHGPGTVPLPLNYSNLRYTPEKPGGVDNDKISYYATVDLNLGFGTLTWIPSYFRYVTRSAIDILNTGAPSFSRYNDVQHTEELRLASAASSPITWLVGAYYLKYHRDTKPFNTSVAPGSALLTFPYVVTSPDRTESYAAFAQATVPITRAFRITGGLRYTSDDKQATANKYVNGLTVDPAAPANTTERKDDAWTYKAGVEYDVVPGTLAYAQVSRGYRAGGINDYSSSPLPGGQINGPPSTYAPEYLTSWEGGVKSRIGQTIQLDLAAYHYSYDNQQVLSIVLDPLGGPPQVKVQNAAKATLYGFELEGQWAVTRHDHLTGSLTYNHTRFDKFLYQSLIWGAPPTFIRDFSGEREPNAPLWTESLGYEHVFDLSGGATLTAAAEIHNYSSQAVTVEPIPGSMQGAFHETDARLIYTAPGGKWSARAYVTNLEDKAIRLAAMSRPGFAGVQLAPPRLYGVAIDAKF